MYTQPINLKHWKERENQTAEPLWNPAEWWSPGGTLQNGGHLLEPCRMVVACWNPAEWWSPGGTLQNDGCLVEPCRMVITWWNPAEWWSLVGTLQNGGCLVTTSVFFQSFCTPRGRVNSNLVFFSFSVPLGLGLSYVTKDVKVNPNPTVYTACFPPTDLQHVQNVCSVLSKVCNELSTCSRKI